MDMQTLVARMLKVKQAAKHLTFDQALRQICKKSDYEFWKEELDYLLNRSSTKFAKSVKLQFVVFN